MENSGLMVLSSKIHFPQWEKETCLLFNLPLFSWTGFKIFLLFEILYIYKIYFDPVKPSLPPFFSAAYPVFSLISYHHVLSFVVIDNHLSLMSVVSMCMEWGHSLENGQPIDIRSQKESDSFSFGNDLFSIAILSRIGPLRVLCHLSCNFDCLNIVHFLYR